MNRGALDYEADFWGLCANTYHEEQKQLVYAQRMGLFASWHGAHPPTFNIGGRSVIDVGGGPCSLLLKCVERGRCSIIDPGEYPPWVSVRYKTCGIDYIRAPAEDPSKWDEPYDEAWIYNCLTHVTDPHQIIKNARRAALTIRIFEWLEDEPRPGHPHTLHAAELDEWLGVHGFTSHVDDSGAVGLAYYSVARPSRSF